MTTQQSLYEDYQRKLKELQESCEHLETTWADEWWATGHATGRLVRVCDCCGLTVEIKESPLLNLTVTVSPDTGTLDPDEDKISPV